MQFRTLCAHIGYDTIAEVIRYDNDTIRSKFTHMSRHLRFSDLIDISRKTRPSSYRGLAMELAKDVECSHFDRDDVTRSIEAGF